MRSLTATGSVQHIENRKKVILLSTLAFSDSGVTFSWSIMLFDVLLPTDHRVVRT